MKVATFYSDGHIVEIENSIWGVECVKVDGQVVSSKYSTFGYNHQFVIEHDGKENIYQVQFRMGIPAAININKNGEPVFESPKYGFWRVFLAGVIFILFYELIRHLF